MKIGETIVLYRKRKNMSQGELAKEMNVSRQTIIKWEKDKSYPKIERLEKLTLVLNITYSQLLIKRRDENGEDY